jgi:TldD protein
LILETARTTLLEPFELAEPKLARIFGTLAARKVDYADLYFQYARSEGWSLEEGIVKSASFNIEQGVGVRAVSGEKTAFAYSDEISFDALEDAAKATRAIASAGQARVVKAATRNLPTPLYAAVDPIASLPSEAKVALLEKVERKCRALDSRITQVMASLGGEYEVVLIARADGHLAADVRRWCASRSRSSPRPMAGARPAPRAAAGAPISRISPTRCSMSTPNRPCPRRS